jgi:hypothetical protein
MWVLLLAGWMLDVGCWMLDVGCWGKGVVTALAINLTGFAIAGYTMTSGLAPLSQKSCAALPYVWMRSGTIITLFSGSSAVAVAL